MNPEAVSLPSSIYTENLRKQKQYSSDLTLYEAWLQLNDNLLFTMDDDEFLLAGRELPKGRDFSYMLYHVTLNATGWGLPESTPLLGHERRTKLLRGRYVHDILWKEAVERLKVKAKKLGGPMSYVFPFYRTKDTPTGGGCLVSVVLTWYNKSWKIHVMSRASEVTIRLLGDIYFMKSMIDEILSEIPLRHWPENPEISWTLLLCSQMKHVMPFYLLHTRGDEFVKNYMMSPPQHLRHQGIQEYFWGDGVHPDRIKWMQRRRWTDRFLQESKLDWLPIAQEYWGTYEEKTGRPVPEIEKSCLQGTPECGIIITSKPTRKFKIVRRRPSNV